MKYLIGLMMIALLSCGKDADFPTDKQWLVDLRNSYSNCTCIMVIREGTYQNKRVFETGTIGPTCNGINIVYDEQGNVLLTSAEPAKFAGYIAEVQNLREIWRCSK
jgi:hypothetical protein